MYYFSFDTTEFDKFDFHKKIVEGEIESAYFYIVLKETDLKILTSDALNEELKIPANNFSVECSSKTLEEIQEILLEYSKKDLSLLNNKSLNDFGIKIKFEKEVSDEEIEAIYEKRGFTIFHE